MKNKNIWWIIIAVVVAIILLILLIPKKKLVSFEDFEFPETITVENSTSYEIDTISMILASEVFEWDSLNLKIVYLPRNISDNNDYIFLGMVQQLPFGSHQYLLLLDRKLNFNEILTILSHEFIHIEQIRTKRLIIEGKNYWWGGEQGVFERYDTSRPFEEEAFRNQYRIKKELINLIYE